MIILMCSASLPDARLARSLVMGSTTLLCTLGLLPQASAQTSPASLPVSTMTSLEAAEAVLMQSSEPNAPISADLEDSAVQVPLAPLPVPLGDIPSTASTRYRVATSSTLQFELPPPPSVPTLDPAIAEADDTFKISTTTAQVEADLIRQVAIASLPTTPTVPLPHLSAQAPVSPSIPVLPQAVTPTHSPASRIAEAFYGQATTRAAAPPPEDAIATVTPHPPLPAVPVSPRPAAPPPMALVATASTSDLGLWESDPLMAVEETLISETADFTVSQVPAGNSSGAAAGLNRVEDATPLLRSTALTPPSVRLQLAHVFQDDEGSSRARITATYPLSPRVLFGASLDFTDGDAFSDSRQEGASINELYLATSLADIPNLRFVIGQLDLTSYFDRNSFAKDAVTHFFSPVLQTNPALAAANLASRPGVLVNWSVTDNIEARAAAFSSARSIGDFSLDGFAGEIAVRYGNAILRGTYISSRDAGSGDGFDEIYGFDRGNGQTGVFADDREEAYGLNAEVFVPELKLGIFGRYGHYENRTADIGADTYSLGVNFLDVFAPDDRLGLAYGRGLSNDDLRRISDDRTPDVWELFYDFRLLSNLRVGLTVQERNDFSETIVGFRIKTEFDLIP